ncbi:hypothetical protein Tco_0255190 [Tanacetum coccineum]
MKEQAYNKIKSMTKTQELKDKEFKDIASGEIVSLKILSQTMESSIFYLLMKLEKKVKAMSKIDDTEATDKSVQAHLKKVLPKDVPDFNKIK